jgi:cytidine deaminase
LAKYRKWYSLEPYVQDDTLIVINQYLHTSFYRLAVEGFFICLSTIICMKKKTVEFIYDLYENAEALDKRDAQLLQQAKAACDLAYAPYSKFHVGAVALLKNGVIIKGSNQENASFPVGLCAERVLLAAATSAYPGVPIETIAISYSSKAVQSNHPISPCGICRQSLSEYEERLQHPIRLILGGLEGKVFIIPTAGTLLPLSFTSSDMK